MKNKYIEQNSEKWAEYYKKWCADNKDRLKLYQTRQKGKGYYKKWFDEHKDEESKRKALWYQQNKERLQKKSSEYIKINKDKVNLRRKKYFSLHPERIRVQKIVKKAIKDGVLIKLPCAVCGDTKVEAHHDNYSEPLKVSWLCKLHHQEADKIRRSKELLSNDK